MSIATKLHNIPRNYFTGAARTFSNRTPSENHINSVLSKHFYTGLNTGLNIESHQPKTINRNLASISLTSSQDSFIASRSQYPSDHYPIFGNVLDLNIGSFNWLNSAYTDPTTHVVRECWQNSYFMTQEKKPSLLYPGLSMREEECYHLVKGMMLSDSNSLDALCIQECSDKMFLFLKKEFSNLKSSNQIQLFMTDGGMRNHVVMLVKPSSSLKVTASFGKAFWNRKYVPRETKTAENPKGIEQFGLDIWRPASIVELEKTTPSGKIEKLVLVGVHVSCAGEEDDYRLDRANELALGINELTGPDRTVVSLGDFNMSGCVTSKSELQKFHDLTPGHRHVDAKIREIMAIDRIFVDTAKEKQTFCGPISLEDGPDPQAAESYKAALDPVISGLVSF